MKTRSKAKTKARGKPAPDPQVAEFDGKDLGGDIRASGTGRVLRRGVKPTSILLDDKLIAKLRAKGAKRGLDCQTMLKLIVREHVDEY